MEGWISLNRQIQEHWLWKGEPFSHGQAWIDLLLLANYEDKKMPYKGEVIVCKRGDVNLSFLTLAKRWKWHRTTVRRFLDTLASDGMVTVNATTKRTTITIVNYDKFQLQGTTDATTDVTNHAQVMRQIAHITNKDNKDNNNYLLIGDMYNETCVSFPRLKSLSDSRKKAIKARLKTYTVEDFKTMFEKAEASDFLKGGNNRNWNATFDWMIKDSNMAKILDGNYDNKKGAANEVSETEWNPETWNPFE